MDGIFVLFLIIGTIIFTIIGSNMGARRNIGSTNGALLGLFLGLIGILIISAYPKIQQEQLDHSPNWSTADELKKYKDLLDSGAINEQEYNVKKWELLNK